MAEIAAASKEQAQGIEQVNTAVAEMDKVTQQNAANAEESASAAEEMTAQAETMQGMVGDWWPWWAAARARATKGRRRRKNQGPRPSRGERRPNRRPTGNPFGLEQKSSSF